METKVVYLHFTPKDTNLKILHKIRECKSPSRVAEYKFLEKVFNQGNLQGYGYTTELDDLDYSETEVKVNDLLWLVGMIRSIYTYNDGVVDIDNEYLKEYIDKLGAKLVNIVVNNQSRIMSLDYEIKKDVYKDSEGCVYNSLVKI